MTMKRSTLVALTVLLFVLVALLLVVIVHTMSRRQDTVDKSKSMPYRFAAVAADNGLCSQVGNEILARHGGSAVDAAIASLLCIGVVNSQHAGLGGGVMMVIHERANGETEKQLVTLIGRETAPLYAHAHMFDNDPHAQEIGTKSIAVPGEINGYHEAWKRFGRVPWRILFEPAIEMCRNGWPVSKSMAASITSVEDVIQRDPELRSTFVKADGKLYAAGEMITNEKLARTLERIASEGAKTFYEGALADDIVKDIQDAGGNMSTADLRSNTAFFVEPLTRELYNGDYNIATPPPPSSGIIVQLILAIMDGYNLTSNEYKTLEDKCLLLHRLIEAWKLGFMWRDLLGDIRFAEETLHKVLSKLQTRSFVDELRTRIRDNEVRDAHTYDTSHDVEGTSHVSIVTADGAAVSATSTVGSLFGSKVLGSRTGIIFNNLMELFDLPAKTTISANQIAPLKRGLSATSPFIVYDSNRQVALVIGAAGGNRILTASTFVAVQNLWLNEDIASAIDAARLHHQLEPDTLYYDRHFPQDLLEALQDKGHRNIAQADTKYPYLAVVQAVDVQNQTICQQKGVSAKCLNAVCDYRKGGFPDGY